MQCDSCCPNLSWWTNQTYELAWLIVPWLLLALALLSFTASFTAFFSTLFTVSFRASFTASFTAYQPYCLNTSCHLALAPALQSQHPMPCSLNILCHLALFHSCLIVLYYTILHYLMPDGRYIPCLCALLGLRKRHYSWQIGSWITQSFFSTQSFFNLLTFRRYSFYNLSSIRLF